MDASMEDLTPSIRKKVKLLIEGELDQMRTRKDAFTSLLHHLTNKHLCEVMDLYQDLRDGKVLRYLCAHFSKEILPSLPPDANNKKLIHLSLDFLKKQGVDVSKIKVAGVAEGDVDQTLELVWSIFHRYYIVELEIKDKNTGTSKTGKEALLLWAQRTAKRDDASVDIDNFTGSWRDGRAFLALLSSHGVPLADVATQTTIGAIANLQRAFTAAEKELDVPSIITPADVDKDNPDEKSLMLYVACLYHRLPRGGDVPSDPVDNNTNDE